MNDKPDTAQSTPSFFATAVAEIAAATQTLLDLLETNAPKKQRDQVSQ
jgi:hypothetical protein